MGIVLGHHIGDPAISLQATPVTLMPMIESSFHDDPIHQVKHIEDFIENEFEDNISDFDKVIVYEEECYNLPINIINL